jgi:hypothetical protein
MACRVSAVLPRQGHPVSGPARWCASTPDFKAHLLLPAVRKFSGSDDPYVTRCAQRVMMLTALQESPPRRICLSCAAGATSEQRQPPTIPHTCLAHCRKGFCECGHLIWPRRRPLRSLRR